MATKDSKELETNERYPLGEYSFRIERSSGTSPNYDKIEAICTKGGKNARKSIQIPSSTQLDGWHVEANETEASVYVSVEIDQPEIVGATKWSSPLATLEEAEGVRQYYFGYEFEYPAENASGNINVWKNGVFVNQWYGNMPPVTFRYSSNPPYTSYVLGLLNGSIYGNHNYYPMYIYEGPMPSEKVKEEILVARFAINLEDAGGDGPGSDWIDPGDYDPDWEEGDPTHTLYVNVTGALSGRHNDPIEDPSYSYIPADKDTVKDYGCGGDGGHGGGGGAGASTVVVHKFATNQANSKEVTAIAKRHGYGSGGGKGGKGGDGCVLIYY